VKPLPVILNGLRIFFRGYELEEAKSNRFVPFPSFGFRPVGVGPQMAWFSTNFMLLMRFHTAGERRYRYIF
jgi:hypothetical protein